MKTKSEILEDFGCPVPDFHENVTMFYPAIHFAMDEYAQHTAMEFAELLYSWESKLEVLNVSIFNLSEAANPNTITTFTVLQYQQMQLTQCINDLKQLFAKFEAERNQQQSELTCPICQSNRILELPDKYQCRKCEHVWERSVK